jgi:hypothetical protein
MGVEESLIGGTAKAGSRKVPVLGIAIGAAETAKNGWDAKSACKRALDPNRSEQERIAAIRISKIYGRRAMFKAGSTIAAQIPGYGTIASLAVDGADIVLRTMEGDPQKIEKPSSEKIANKKRSTEAFMQTMREQAAKENLHGNNQTQSIRQS